FYRRFWLAIGQWMKVAHECFQAFFQDVRINLCRRNIGMPEKCLHYTKIRAIVQQMAGEGMAQHMRAQARGLNSARRSERLEVACKMLTRQMAGFSERGKQPL